MFIQCGHGFGFRNQLGGHRGYSKFGDRRGHFRISFRNGC
jgi:hypothetical protein